MWLLGWQDISLLGRAPWWRSAYVHLMTPNTTSKQTYTCACLYYRNASFFRNIPIAWSIPHRQVPELSIVLGLTGCSSNPTRTCSASEGVISATQSLYFGYIHESNHRPQSQVQPHAQLSALFFLQCSCCITTNSQVREECGIVGVCENDSDIVVDLLSVLRIASTVSTKLPALALLAFGAVGGLLATFQIATSSLFHWTLGLTVGFDRLGSFKL